MRSGYIQRRTSLRRGGPIRKRKLTPRRSSRVIDLAYRRAVAELPCRARHLSPCDGVVDPDHQGRRGMGQKCSDYECVPMCRLHHELRLFKGPFASWSGAEMDQWLYEGIVETQTKLLGAPLSTNSRRPGGVP